MDIGRRTSVVTAHATRFGRTACVLAALMMASCATTPTPQFERADTRHAVERPERILVYDFAGTRGDLPPDSPITGYFEQNEAPQTGEDVELGRQLGRQVAQQVVARLRAAGIDAYPVGAGPVPKLGDVVLRGEFVSITPGSRTTRVLIGFGAGRGELSTLVEAFQITATGPRSLATAEANTQGGRLPGVLLPLGLASAAGSVATSAAVSGTSNVMQERGPESIRAAAQRTATGIADSVIAIYRRNGWLAAGAGTGVP
ncbi:DUF4410 domain-containing protein [Lysobacter auxotrophicus]|uniref:DUF4410 domain-containing protein n=1 Tax=Lysobacter auxotrophicus TaxID=2992573 RepID=A0ABN6UNL7_9GAMM|nr:DUF4410 domain-containing protein [Lysobacter auxotrophicus]BDU16453.1 DUF4410 domain-containing protein [Lysobacter auxotrophicus]